MLFSIMRLMSVSRCFTLNRDYYSFNTPNCNQTRSPKYAVVDSGATDTFLPMSYRGTDEQLVSNGIKVQCANKTHFTSEATDILNTPTLRTEMLGCHIFADSAMAKPLFAVKKVTNAKGSVHFFPNIVVLCDKDAKILLTGPHQHHQQRHVIPIDGTNHIKSPKPRELSLINTLRLATAPMRHTARLAVTDPDIYHCAMRGVHLAQSSIPAYIRYLHAAAGYPPKTTWLKAISNNQYHGWPIITPQQVGQYLPQDNEHTTMGHLQTTRQGIQSTQEMEPPHAPGAAPRSKAHSLGTYLRGLKNLIATDFPGRFPVTSARGHKYLFILHDYDTNFIYAVPIQSREGTELLHGFKACYKELLENGFRAKDIRCDNEISNIFTKHMELAELTYQLASPGNHRTNPAEQAIQTFKNHFISILSGTDEDFPDNSWDLLITHVNITLNLLRPSGIQPKLSAYAQIYGPFDFNKNPLAPGGCALIIHERIDQRPSWANHGPKGFYISPAMQHYRNYKCYIPSTRGTRFSNTDVMNPRQCALPTESPLD